MCIIRKAKRSVRGRVFPLVIQETLDHLLCLHMKAKGACTGFDMLWETTFRLAARVRGGRGSKTSISQDVRAAYDPDSKTSQFSSDF